MSERRPGGDETRVWQRPEIEAAMTGPRRGHRRQRAGGWGGGGSTRWQTGWRVALWALALALGWFAGTRYFG